MRYLTYSGNNLIDVELPDDATVLYPPEAIPGIPKRSIPQALREAVENPLGMPPLKELVGRLVPFNYVVPGQSVNDIINLRAIIEGSERLRPFLPDLVDHALQLADHGCVSGAMISSDGKYCL